MGFQLLPLRSGSTTSKLWCRVAGLGDSWDATALVLDLENYMARLGWAGLLVAMKVATDAPVVAVLYIVDGTRDEDFHEIADALMRWAGSGEAYRGFSSVAGSPVLAEYAMPSA